MGETIKDMMGANEGGVSLIRDNRGNIILIEFKEVCDSFIIHAKDWSKLWYYTVGDSTVPGSFWGRDRLLFKPFPKSMDSLLQLEIKEREKLIVE